MRTYLKWGKCSGRELVCHGCLACMAKGSGGWCGWPSCTVGKWGRHLHMRALSSSSWSQLPLPLHHCCCHSWGHIITSCCHIVALSLVGVMASPCCHQFEFSSSPGWSCLHACEEWCCGWHCNGLRSVRKRKRKKNLLRRVAAGKLCTSMYGAWCLCWWGQCVGVNEKGTYMCVRAMLLPTLPTMAQGEKEKRKKKEST